MLDLILRIIQLIIVVLIIILEIILLVYIVKIRSKKPTKELKRNASIEKYKIGKKILYKIIPKSKINNKFDILYFHGGAYSSGLNKTHWNFVERLCNDIGANIFVPDYPLVPKNTYKNVFNMVDEIYNNYIKQDNFIIIGDSAGGGISLAFSQKLGEENKKMPEKIILISPWLDITMKNEEINKVQEKDKLLNKNVLKLAGELYCGRDDANNYLVSPLNGKVDKINNVFIFTGTNDILNPDVSIFREKVDKDKLFIYEKEEAEHNWVLDTHKYELDYQNLLNAILK